MLKFKQYKSTLSKKEVEIIESSKALSIAFRAREKTFNEAGKRSENVMNSYAFQLAYKQLVRQHPIEIQGVDLSEFLDCKPLLKRYWGQLQDNWITITRKAQTIRGAINRANTGKPRRAYYITELLNYLNKQPLDKAE